MNRSLRNRLVFAVFVFATVGYSTAQKVQRVVAKDSTSLLNQSGSFPKVLKQALDNISVSGYYRFIGNYSDMKTQYPEFNQAVPKKVFIGDDSQIPQLLLQITGRPSSTTSFGTDLYLWTPLTGSTTDYVKNLNLGVNLFGSHTTKYGTFNVRTGGIHWYSLSPLTFGTNTGYNRYSIFERNPWDPNTSSVNERYDKFFSSGALSQDIRWGQQAFQGIIVDGEKLPAGFSFAFMYGKTQFNGGSINLPNSSTGGRLKKQFGRNFVSLNTFSSNTFSDSLATRRIGFEIHTIEFDIEKFGFLFKGEVGAGKYNSPSSKNKWGEALNLKLKLPQKWTFLPVEIHYFQLSPRVINNNGIFWNTSVVEYNEAFAGEGTAGSQTVLIPFASSMLQIGQMTNNRKGVELNTEYNTKKLKISFGYHASQEIDALTRKIAFSHPANNLAISRFWRWAFPANVGPYKQLNKIYRGVYETVEIADSATAKGFNAIELNIKYKTKLFNRDLYIFYLGAYSSAQSTMSVLPVYSQKAYIQTYYHQLEFYYSLGKRFTLTNYFGYDRIIGNDRTRLDTETGRAKNQTGWSFATGFDWYVAKNVGLYFRNRWFTNSDANFSLDRYQGMESTVEFKIYF